MRPANAFSISLSPSFGEFDAGGALYHPNYFHLFERAREALLEASGIPYAQFAKKREHLLVTWAETIYLRPIVYGDNLKLYLWASTLKRASVYLHYEIENIVSKHPADRQNLSSEQPLTYKASKTLLVHQATTKHAFASVQDNGLRIKPFPDSLRKVFLTIVAS